jgi:hypothetical protein
MDATASLTNLRSASDSGVFGTPGYSYRTGGPTPCSVVPTPVDPPEEVANFTPKRRHRTVAGRDELRSIAADTS